MRFRCNLNHMSQLPKLYIFTSMKRFLGVLLLLMYLFSGTEAHQLLKLPVLLSHFQEHTQQDEDFGVFDFLVMHYVNGDSLDDDFEKDRELPFKSEHQHVTDITVANVVELQLFSIETPFPLFVESKFGSLQERAISNTNSSIWQPPKHA